MTIVNNRQSKLNILNAVVPYGFTLFWGTEGSGYILTLRLDNLVVHHYPIKTG